MSKDNFICKYTNIMSNLIPFSASFPLELILFQKRDYAWDCCKTVIGDEGKGCFPRCCSLWRAAAFCCCIFIGLNGNLEGQLGLLTVISMLQNSNCQKWKRRKTLKSVWLFLSCFTFSLFFIFLGYIWPRSFFQHSVASYYFSCWL